MSDVDKTWISEVNASSMVLHRSKRQHLRLLFAPTMSSAIHELPPLPQHDTLAWTHNVQSAYRALSQMYTNARHAASQGDSDPLRIKYHFDNISKDAVQLLRGLEDEGTLPREWLMSVAQAFGMLARVLGGLQGGINGV